MNPKEDKCKEICPNANHNEFSETKDKDLKVTRL